jgi:hypothetical protein
MALDTTSMTNLYTALFDAAVVKFNALWDANRIDAELYSKYIGELSAALLKEIPGIIQQQQQLDKDLELKEAQRLQVIEETINITKQRELLEAQIAVAIEEIDLKKAQVDTQLKEIELKEHQLTADRDRTEAELEKQWGYDVTRDADGSLILGTSTGLGKVDKEVIAIVHSMDVQDQETALKDRQVSDQEITSEKQRLDIDVGIAVKEQQIVSAKIDDDLKQVKIEDELLTSSKQRDDIIKGIEVKEMQRKNLYVEMVGKDKETAKMGLDNVVKNAEAARATNPAIIYTPKYGVI